MKKGSDVLSSQMSLCFANKNKLSKLNLFITEYRRVCRIFIKRFENLILTGEKLSRMPSGPITNVETWLSARAIQCAAKQISGIVNGAFEKNKRREWQAKKFEEIGQIGKARKLREIIKKNPVGKIKIKRVEPQLDARFFSLEIPKNSRSFDYWINFSSLGNKLKFSIPLKRHKHLNKLLKSGRIMQSVRLSEKAIAVSVEMEKAPTKFGQKTLGIDIGQKSIFSTSEKTRVVKDSHGHSLDSINAKMALCRRGSKGFKRCEKHRKNFVRWSVNQLNLKDVSTIRIEKIRNLKLGRKTSKKLSHWSYPEIFGALKAKAQKLGVQVEEINPRWTSQRCSCCGWVRKRNRKGEKFHCDSCGNEANADENAAINISLHLSVLPKNAVEDRMNLNGFFWPEEDELIVRLTQEPKKI